MSEWTGKKITDGTDQSRRCPVALKEGYFNVDEMSFEDLLALSAEFAAELPYYNLKNKKQGSWEALFTADETVVMAMIICSNPERMKQDYHHLSDSDLTELLEYVYQYSKRINFWFQKLKCAQNKSALALSKIISGVVKEKLAADLHGIGKSVEYLKTQEIEIEQFDFSCFDKIWGIEKDISKKGSFLFPKARLSEFQSSKQLQGFFRSTVYSILNAVSYLKTITPNYLQDTLQSNTHQPAMGLFLAFLKLYQNAQHQINRFTRRHLEFYYYQYLKGLPQKTIPENAHIILQTETAANEVLIAKGTQFTAGKDIDLKDIIYSAENDLLVSDAKVQALYTLHFLKDKLISPEYELNCTTRAKADCLLASQMDKQQVTLGYWPLFGAEKKHAPKGSATDAEIGFAIASSHLLLKEGVRLINITIGLADPVDINAAVDIALKCFANKESSLEYTLTQIFTQYLLNDQEFVNKANKNYLSKQAEYLTRQLLPHMKQLNEQMQQLKYNSRQQQDFVYRVFLMEMLKQSDTAQMFFKTFGRIFSHYILASKPWLTEENKSDIIHKAKTCVDKSSLEQIRRFLTGERHNLFHKVLKDPFSARITAQNGWHEVVGLKLLPLSDNQEDIYNGLKFELTLDADVESIVPYDESIHTGLWQTAQPLIRFDINARANFYPYSLFYGLALNKVIIETEVKGVKDIKAYNQYGRLDPSKPFNPFGPLPSCNSYLIIGNYEIAKKNITDLKMSFQWGELPRVRDGFEEYYAGYETAYSNEIFKADVSVLQNAKWQPRCSRPSSKITLFETQQNSSRIKPTTISSINVLTYTQTIHPRIQEDEFDYQLHARNGFFRFMLSAPGAAFGHAEYPGLLTQVLTENAKRKKPKALPNSPYTPILNSISFDYKARTEINVSKDVNVDDNPFGEKVFHIHPFGLETLYPKGREKRHYFFPQYEHCGNLFIGLSASQLSNTVTLFFNMADDSTQTPVYGKSEIVWYYLAANGWCRLEESHVVSDTTQGFISSGIVTLNIPEDINRGNSIMPGDLYWLRVSANKDLNSYASLRAVRAQAIKIKRLTNAGASTHKTESTLLAGSWQPLKAIPNLGKVTPIGQFFDYRQKEDHTQLKTRMSERLRHKYRACTPWDYERLILAEFPEVYKVKCFSNISINNPQPQPGHVLIVVVPYLQHIQHGKCFAAKMNIAYLNNIHRFIEKLTPAFVKVEVHNPVYEHIQVRCTVKFSSDIQSGLFIKRLNQDVSDYICPWCEMGYKAKFGWNIRREDIESYVRRLDYVDFVTNFSMLHITQIKEDRFSLGDTAKRDHSIVAAEQRTNNNTEVEPQAEPNNSEKIRPTYPWSLAVPAKSHFIETMETIKPIKADATGINELEVGNTLIISGNNYHAEEE